MRLLKSFRDWLWIAVRGACDDEPRLRFFFTAVDTGVSTLAGIVEDGVLEHGFDVINDEEWAAWLARHGAKEITIGRTPEERAPVLRSVYDVAFGYPRGSIAAADVAAGTATSDLLRLAFSYRGSIMYKMQAGMGDAVFTPLYEVLRARGVRFRFFHAVTGLRPRPRRERPAEPRGQDRGDRAGEAGSGPRRVPPARGRRGARVLAERAALGPARGPAAEGREFELELERAAADPHTLERSGPVSRDFDEVVLAIPVGALGPICAAS